MIRRGTADLGQGWSTAKISAVPRVVFNETLQLYQAPYHSVMGLWPSVAVAVDTALAATANPAAARVWVTGHSLGGASACLAALLLAERGTRIGGVYAFGPYKVGNSCGADTACWASVYDRVLADVTWAWWNNQDPVPGARLNQSTLQMHASKHKAL
jgi:pimeloyl-ACP methyl ester carboxylesterase